MEDYYQVLGVPPDASQEALKERFRFLAHAYHPDRFASSTHKKHAEETFKRINEAYHVLSNPGRRVQYDRQRSSSDSRYEEERRRREEAEAARSRAQEERQQRAKADERERHAEKEQSQRERHENTDVKTSTLKISLVRLGVIIRDASAIWLIKPQIVYLIINSYKNSSHRNLVVIGIASIVVEICGFTICGLIKKRKIWSHLFFVAILYWALDFLYRRSGFYKTDEWLSSVLSVFLNMIIGGGISYLFNRRRQSSSDSKYEEERRRGEESEAAQRRAQEERRKREEAEAAQRHAQEERRKREEAEAARRRAEEERRKREEAEAAQRRAKAEQQRREQTQAKGHHGGDKQLFS